MTDGDPLPTVGGALAMAPYRPRRTELVGVVSRRGWQVKIVGISADGQPLPQDTVDAALVLADAHLPQPAPAGAAPRAAFLVVHRGEDALWVIVCRWELELLHQRLFRSALDSTALRPVGPDGPTACVWELLAIDHERRAWVNHVLVHPDRPDLAAYLAAGSSRHGPDPYRTEAPL